MSEDKSFRLLLLLALVPILLGQAALHAHDALAVLADEATVYEEESGNNGGGDSLICIGNQATSETRRAFVRYTLPAIAPGSTIDRVVWQIFQDRVRSNGGPLTATLEVHQVTAVWAEGTGSGGGTGPCGGGANVAGVDWASQPTVATGTSATAALSANDDVNVVIDTDTGTSDDGLIADVQAWVENGASNFGWRLGVTQEGTANNARVLAPGTLTIYWTPPPEDIVFADGFETP